MMMKAIVMNIFIDSIPSEREVASNPAT